MGFKDPDRKREYFRKYMKERRKRKTQTGALNLIELEVPDVHAQVDALNLTKLNIAPENSIPDVQKCTSFRSAYRSIVYRIPLNGGVQFARFEDGRFATEDERVIAYLREHRDFGTTLCAAD